MLTHLDEPERRRARIHVYDLEWLPGKMDLRMIGVKDPARGYRAYVRKERDTPYGDPRIRGVGDTNADIVRLFLEGELIDRHREDWFYAHAGGLADATFLLDPIAKDPRYSVDAAFSGSSAVIITIKRGSCSWKLLDSYWTLRSPLAAIGEKLGANLKKGSVNWDAPMPDMLVYNERDCDILYKALSDFEDILLSLGSELRSTLAACAMRLIRRQYITHDIRTSNLLNRRLRPAYVGGRVEVFYKKPLQDWQDGKLTPGYYYDVNSMYPFAMTMPLPGNYRGRSRDMPAGDKRRCYFADVTITVPRMQLPPLPYVYDKSLYFPTGTFRALLCGPEIERALEVGCRIEKLHSCRVYDAFRDLRDFALDIYNKRLAAKAKGLGYLELVYKLLLNSGYGKFGERGDKVQLLFHPTAKRLQDMKRRHRMSIGEHEAGKRDKPLREPRRYPTDPPTVVRERRGGNLHLVEPGIFLAEKSVPTHSTHVPIAAYVTSLARVILHKHLCAAKELPLYCDTDGFMTADPDVPCGEKLGELKREKVVADSLFFAPKLYCLIEESGNTVVRAKGFGGLCACLKPLGCVDTQNVWDGKAWLPVCDSEPRFTDGGLEYRCPACGLGRGSKTIGRKAFESLIGGQAAITNRMMRLRQLYGRGETAPREMIDKRTVAGSKPKRCFKRDGTSRPWSVDELHTEKHVEQAEIQRALAANRRTPPVRGE